MKTIKGTYDILPEESEKWQAVEDLIRQICWVYDYKEIRTPIFEATEVFKRENDSSDMVNKEMYTFDVGRNSLTLRPEGTAGIIRSFTQHKLYGSMEMPGKFYYVGPMFRHENPQKGRQRQFHQFGIENIGVKNPIIDVEVMALGYSFIKSLGLSSIKVLVNTLGDEVSRKNYQAALKDYIKPILPELCDDCRARYEKNPLRILDCKVDCDHPKIKDAITISDYLTEESKAYFAKVLEGLDALQIPYEVSQQLVRGLDYYTETVFEVISTQEESGSQSTIFGGGRYDNLVQYFGGPEMSGVGFAVGLERLLILAEIEGIDFGNSNDVDVYVMSFKEAEVAALVAAVECRAAGYKTELNVVDRSMKSQFKSVDRKNAKIVVIVGEDEAKNNQVAVKCIATQEQLKVDVTNLVQVIDNFFEKENHDDHHGECHNENCKCKGE
ncbi:MAG: histidine--tRNA ligase [Anaerorhabdus sp.]